MFPAATRFVRALSLLRVVWGLVLLLRTRGALRRLHGLDAGPAEVAVARVLGGRQVAQGVVTAWCPSPTVLVIGEAADVLHGATGAALVVLDVTRRRAGIVEFVVADAFAAATEVARR